MTWLVLSSSLALASCFHFSSETGKSSWNIPTTQPGKGLITEGIRGGVARRTRLLLLPFPLPYSIRKKTEGWN